MKKHVRQAQQATRRAAVSAGKSLLGRTISINKAGTGYKVHDKSPLDKANERYSPLHTKALAASHKAETSGLASDHKVAAEAHRKAGIAAGKAGFGATEQLTHRNAAIVHHNIAREKSGSFGTDPATGNPQSKAKVLDHSPSASAKRVQVGDANMARAKASAASEHANKVNTPEAHRTAATAHSKASTAARLAGIPAGAEAHQQAAREHTQKANASGSGYMAGHRPATPPVLLGQPPKGRGLGRVNAKGERVTGHRANVTGIPGAKGNMNDGGRVGARDPVRQRLDKAMRSLHPTYDTTKKPPATPAGSAAKAHAEALSAKANAHPSPAAHRAAGDAHYKASQYGENDGRHHISTGNAHYAQGKAAYAKSAGTTPNKVGGGKTTAVGPHVPGHPDYTHAKGASHHAHTQTAKALAKPSLASHSIAAKAHTQAASAHAHGSPEHQKHLSEATFHRTAASNFSHKIMKLKKLGPGQHHGRGGRFEGTPGGAK